MKREYTISYDYIEHRIRTVIAESDAEAKEKAMYQIEGYGGDDYNAYVLDGHTVHITSLSYEKNPRITVAGMIFAVERRYIVPGQPTVQSYELDLISPESILAINNLMEDPDNEPSHFRIDIDVVDPGNSRLYQSDTSGYLVSDDVTEAFDADRYQQFSMALAKVHDLVYDDPTAVKALRLYDKDPEAYWREYEG